MSAAYIIRPSGVAHETIDGETVIIDMQQGTYYRLEGAASVAWENLSSGATVEQLSANLAARFVGDTAAIGTQVAEFLEALRAFNLIVPLDGKEPVATPKLENAIPKLANTGTTFPGLAVHRFTDLQELFWIDPVHEVDDTGWPTTRSG
jgi:hypothetical protein